jgi:protease II
MKNHSHLPVLLLLFCILPISSKVIAQSNGGAGAPQPPMTEKKPKTTNIHGTTLVDDFFWLREKTNPAVLAHLKAEDDYAATVMKPTAALQEKLYNEMLSHIITSTTRAPRKVNSIRFTAARKAVSRRLKKSCSIKMNWPRGRNS